MKATNGSAGEAVVRRLIPVPRERVFDAWLDAETMPRWMCPGDVARTTAKIDARVGGHFRIVMTHGGGDAEHWGEYLEIERPSRLSFTWISAATDLQPSIVTIEFSERDGGTAVVLRHRLLPVAKVETHRKGWSDIVRKLSEELS